MVVHLGTDLIVRKFTDEETGKTIEVKISFRDAVFFDYLNKILRELKR